ncbi:MFS transporter [Actinospica sp.]|uniref:MFS transporter n=1 Tax=Actinospica sp. TaxID=1872142 RepID=UPI002C49A589|nr:MFS transporter [Actinospica sp.]HWG24100.1 MFS transporter [Actinospica sp.]
MTLSTRSADAAASPPGSKPAGSPREVLLIVCAGVVLSSLDLFIVNVALPKIAVDLHARDLSELSWILNAYAIVYASLLVFFGRLADRFRRDRAFLLGVAVFTVASAACALSTDVGMLIGFRVLQAAGAALVTPTSLGLVLASYPAERRNGAVRAWTAVGGVAAAIGPVVGGLLVAASWRWVFLVNVPIGIAALVVGWRRLPEVPGHPVERPDPLGVVLVTAGVGALTFGLVKGSDWGWAAARTDGILVGAVVLLAGFVWHCLHGRSPLIRPELFRAHGFIGASAVAVFFSASFGAMLLSIVLWEQGAWHWSALRTGLAIAPGPLMVPIVAFGIGGRLIRRYGPAPVIAFGSLAFAASTAWWALAITATPDYVRGVLGGMLLTGIGVGLVLPTMMGAATAALPPHSFATGSAVINMIRQTGLALGVAVLIAVLGTAVDQPTPALAPFQHGWWVTAALSAAGVPAVALLRRPQPS